MIIYNDVIFDKTKYEELNHYRQFQENKMYEEILIRELSKNEYYILSNSFSYLINDNCWLMQNGEGINAYQIFSISANEIKQNIEKIKYGQNIIGYFSDNYKKITKKIFYELQRVEYDETKEIIIGESEEYDDKNMVLYREKLTFENNRYYLSTDIDVFDYEYVNKNLRTFYAIQRDSYWRILTDVVATNWLNAHCINNYLDCND